MKSLKLTLIAAFALHISACSMIIESQTAKLADSLQDAMLNFEDPETVASATPTFLIIMESLARQEDASAATKLSAAQMYGSYAGAFVGDDVKRQKVLSAKAIAYAREGACLIEEKWCDLETMEDGKFETFIQALDADDVPTAYSYAVALLGFIQANSDDWGVITQLARAQALLGFVLKHDEAYDNAGAHLYMGAIETTLPPALGGKPEAGQAHFLRALELTNGKHLLVKVEYARRYARMMFDEELHHQLLTEVMEADIHVEDLVLMNAWAQQEAQKLLDDESDYFD